MKAFSAKSPEASQLRVRKYQLVRQYGFPEDAVGGSFGPQLRRCGKPNCHCASGRGHAQWAVTFSRQGKRRVERVPRPWVEDLEQAVLETQTYLDALQEVMAINLELLAMTRAQEQAKKVRLRQKNRK